MNDDRIDVSDEPWSLLKIYHYLIMSVLSVEPQMLNKNCFVLSFARNKKKILYMLFDLIHNFATMKSDWKTWRAMTVLQLTDWKNKKQVVQLLYLNTE